MRFLFIALLTLLAAACASYATFDVNEAELEGFLQTAVKKFDEQQAAEGSPFSVSLSEVHIQVGPDDRNVVVLDAKGEAALNALVTKIPVQLALKLEGSPFYSGKDKAVFIRDLKLINSDIQSPYLKVETKPITDTLMNVLANLLATMPVYRLNENDPKQKLLSELPFNIIVGKGQLKFVPQH